jgi:protein translocase SEC61 complex gamma subunit
MSLNIQEKLQEYKRVLQITKKPDAETFKVIMKVTSMGIGIIGGIGFIVSILYVLIKLGIQ